MYKIKIRFTIMTLLFLVLLLSFTLAFNHINKNYSNKLIIYNQTKHNSCYINILEPTIILRLDDVRAYSVPTPYLVNEIVNRDLAITLGVIPRDLEKDRKIINYLLKIRDNPNIEIAQHGVNHSKTDINVTKEDILEGNIKIQKTLGVLPVTYIPPYNEISKDSKEEVSNFFKILSGEEGIFKEGKKMVEIGYTTKTYDYQNNLEVSTRQIIEKCKKSLDKTNLCVIMIHPQEYSTNISNPTDISETKLKEFKDMLDKLQELNAKFYTFKDIVTCTNPKQDEL